MKSGRLSFNYPLAINTFHRLWPVWAGYLLFLLLTVTAPLLSTFRLPWSDGINLTLRCTEELFRRAVFQASAGAVVAVLLVMLHFSSLYSPRGNTLMNSLPLRRGSIWLTLALTGFIPAILCQALVLLLTALFTRPAMIPAEAFLTSFGCAALSLTAFYGFALFCAMLTGNIVILPAVYFVLNIAAWLFENFVRGCLAKLVFGMPENTARFTFLSPLVKVSDSVLLRGTETAQQLTGMKILGAYAAAGLVFAFFSFLLFRCRRMEAVSDFVAIPVLKPVFRFCMGFGTAFALAFAVSQSVLQDSRGGPGAALMTIVLLILGAALGWFIAEMMIRRSVRVLPLPWKGLCIVFAVCTLTVLAAEFDLTGYEKRVPDPSRVSEVRFSYDTVLTEPENIKKFTELHRRIADSKDALENRSSAPEQTVLLADSQFAPSGLSPDESISLSVPLWYTFSGGGKMQRHYLLSIRPEELDRPESIAGQLLSLLNCREAILSRMQPGIPMALENVNYASIEMESGTGEWHSYRLTPADMLSLWNDAMLPDAEEGHLSRYTIADTEENLRSQTNLRIEVSLLKGTGEYITEQNYWYHSYRVFTDSEHCLDWIARNTDLRWDSLLDVRVAQQAGEPRFR